MQLLFYPAIFHPEETGYSVSVPDIEGCFSQGDTLEEAYRYTQEAMGLCLEACPVPYPKPSAPQDLPLDTGDFLVLLEYDKLAYQKRHNAKAVKKTLTIPAWLNEAAEKQHINFSSVLQTALKQQMHLD